MALVENGVQNNYSQASSAMNWLLRVAARARTGLRVASQGLGHGASKVRRMLGHKIDAVDPPTRSSPTPPRVEFVSGLDSVMEVQDGVIKIDERLSLRAPPYDEPAFAVEHHAFQELIFDLIRVGTAYAQGKKRAEVFESSRDYFSRHPWKAAVLLDVFTGGKYGIRGDPDYILLLRQAVDPSQLKMGKPEHFPW